MQRTTFYIAPQIAVLFAESIALNGNSDFRFSTQSFNCPMEIPISL
jgi:hypothetical protein